MAHLVLAHQTQMHNLITLTNYQTRLALYADEARNKAANLPAGTISEAARLQFQRPAEQLVRYLLFANEAPLEDPVEGGSGYAEEFAARVRATRAAVPCATSICARGSSSIRAAT